MKLNSSYKAGLGFGLTSGVITTLGLIVGLHSGTQSEQVVIGASLPFLNTPNNPPQRRDPGLNPIILIPVSDEVDTCEELMAIRDSLFPPEPSF